MVALNRDTLTGKILEGARISSDDALELYRWPLEELAALANARRDLAKATSYGGRTGFNPRWWRRNTRGPGAKKDFAFENQQRRMARGDAGGARARIEIE